MFLLNVVVRFLMHWFIESQGHIHGEHNWRLYFALNDDGIVSAVSSVYEFHAMPKMRHRVANFLVFPHMQRKGVGTYLLETVYQQALDNDEVMEMTVEDPSMGFCVLRDVMYLLAGVRRGLWTASTLYAFINNSAKSKGKRRFWFCARGDDELNGKGAVKIPHPRLLRR